MKTVFADAFYWAALANPKDEWHPAAMRAGVQHQIGVIITTDEVLLHFDGNDARAQDHRSSHARPPFPPGRFHAFAHRQKRMTNDSPPTGSKAVTATKTKDDTPRAFGEESKLFASINEAYADNYVEVYAPVA